MIKCNEHCRILAEYNNQIFLSAKILIWRMRKFNSSEMFAERKS